VHFSLCALGEPVSSNFENGEGGIWSEVYSFLAKKKSPKRFNIDQKRSFFLKKASNRYFLLLARRLQNTNWILFKNPIFYQLKKIIMHNLDRMMDNEFIQEYGFLNESQMGFNNEMGYEEESSYEEEWEWENAIMGENNEYELAAELLSLSNEAELDQFLGKIINQVGRGLSQFAKSDLGKNLIGGLKSVAKKGLPILGKVAGTFLGGPAGAMIGSKLGSMASNLFEIQGEGMSHEDLEFEMARRYVRFAKAAAQNTVSQANTPAPSKQIVTQAIKQSASQHIPGLMKSQGIDISQLGKMGNAQSGTWTRQGNRIILHGL